jgi:subtilisin family serine protease
MAWYDNPLHAGLWHLYSIGLDKIRGEYSGSRVKVGIFDDGVQADHPDLIGSYSAGLDLRIAGRRLRVAR